MVYRSVTELNMFERLNRSTWST